MFWWLKKLALSLVECYSLTAASKLATKFLMKNKFPRPYPLSLWSPEKKIQPKGKTKEEIKKTIEAGKKIGAANYASWPSLVDRTFTGRHLPPHENIDLPDICLIEEKLFRRTKFIPSPRMSVLFTSFAQWFTDSFLRTDPFDRRMNTSNHEIDLCQIYGLTESTTDILRSGENGKLRHEIIYGAEFPKKLFDTNGNVKHDFEKLPYLSLTDSLLDQARDNFCIPVKERRPYIYATGLERGNSTIGYTSVSTIFLREHNRLCDELKKAHGNWDDDRLFETARIINIACLLKVVIEDYINALAGELGKFRLIPGFADKQRWYRTNRISIEFNLLYRWHGLVPDKIKIGSRYLKHHEFMYNNAFVEAQGVESIINNMSNQKAGAMVLHNTPEFLWEAELGGLSLSRQFQVKPYSFYCDRFGVTRPKSFKELTGNDTLAKDLETIYTGGIGTVDFMVGLRAEKRPPDSVLGDLMLNMVGFDAFSQALTNPLLAENVYMRQTFSDVGWETIEETSSFQDIVNRNIGKRSLGKEIRASFTYT